MLKSWLTCGLYLLRAVQEVKEVGQTLELYRVNYYGRVALLLAAAYLFLQARCCSFSSIQSLL